MTQSGRMTEWPAPARYAAISGVYVAGYLFLDWASSMHALAGGGITPWNPPPALTLVLLLRGGLGYAPMAFVASVVAELLNRDASITVTIALAESVPPTLGYVGAAWLLARRLRFDADLVSVRDLLTLLAIGTAAALTVAPLAALVYAWLGPLPPADYLLAVLRYACGDVIGIAVTAPLLLRLRGPVPVASSRPEVALQVASVLVAMWAVFGLEATDEFKFFYLLFLPLTWVALRHGLTGAALGCLVVQLGVIAATVASARDAHTVIELQGLMLTLAVTVQLAGVVVDERRVQEAARRKLAEQAAHLGRLTLSGEIAAVLAHELNQPLAAVANYARAATHLLDDPAAPPERVRDVVARTEAQAQRAGEALRRLRRFLRRGDAHPSTVPIADLLDEAAEMTAPRARDQGVVVTVRDETQGGQALVDRVHVVQVLLNLLSNAIEALDQTDGGARRVELVAFPAGPGRILVEVWDSGPGVPAEFADRVFESLFTTKPTGMGLGLAISRSLVEAEGGKLEYDVGGPRSRRAFRFTLRRGDDG